MTFKLPDHIAEKFAAAYEAQAAKKAVFANLNDGDLVASAKFWMRHCDAPKRFPSADEPIYDATFWHIIVPELLKRLEKARD